MARVYKNTACKLHGTRYCATLNMVNCNVCTVRDRTDRDVESIMRDIDVVESLMPEGGVSDLFTDERCVLCKGEDREPRSCYALTDLGHAEPKHREAGFLGIKRTAKAGSILPLQLSCCSKCKRRFLLTEYLPVCVGLLTAAIALIALSIRPLREELLAISAMLPFLTFALVSLLGMLAGLLLRGGLSKRFSKRTHMNIFEMPKLREMRRMGWFALYEGKSASKLIFSKNRLRQGIYTNEGMDKNESLPGHE